MGSEQLRHLSPRAEGREIPMGELEMNEGENRVMFKLVGENGKSAGQGLDIYRIVSERAR